MTTVLIVEDEYLEQAFLKEIISNELLPEDRILTCDNGIQAVELAKQYRPNVIIMDIVIPEIDGLCAIEAIRKFSPDACIIISSAYSSFSYAQTAISLHVHEYLLKPVKPSVMKEAFRKALAVSAQNQAQNQTDEAAPKPPAERQDFIEKSLRYIHDHYKERLALETVASHVFMNSQYFSRVFKKEVGMTYTDYVNNLRIVHACKLLETTNFPAYRISSECGFTDPSYFNRVFTRQTNMTPKEYQKNACRLRKKADATSQQ